jgi:hypothetical protein
MPSLVVLRLNGNALTGRIPSALANLTTIQQLQLDENLLEGEIPDGLARLPELQLFTVYGNRLSGEIPSGFFNMSSLQTISLVKNQFWGELPLDAGAHSPSPQPTTSAIPAAYHVRCHAGQDRRPYVAPPPGQRLPRTVLLARGIKMNLPPPAPCRRRSPAAAWEGGERG